jgi:hypothetical protein
METNFVLESIAKAGQMANERFERTLKTELPLDYLLAEKEEPPSVEQIERSMKEQAAQDRNPWPGAAFDAEAAIAKGLTSESPELAYADLVQRSDERDPLRSMIERAVREELKRHVSNVELDEEEEELPEVQLPEDRGGTRFDRDVENMRATIAFRVSEGADKAEAVSALRKVTANIYSQAVIDAAAA